MKNTNKIIVSIILLLLYFNPVQAKWYKIPAKPFEYAWKVLSNPYVQKYGSTFLFVYSQYYDATMDAVGFYKGRRVYGASFNKFHLYKNKARFAGWAAFILKGIELGQGNTDLITCGKWSITTGSLSYVVWHWRKRHVMYNNVFDFSKENNRHIIYIPNPVSDGYIGLQGWEVCTFDLIRLVTGLVGIVRGY